MVRKAVIPAAGLGTRFLPATKALPKEMLPIIDTPVIQYVVQEAVDSGIEDILIISGKGKRAIEDHFDRNFELETVLRDQNNSSMYNEIRKVSEIGNIHFIRQKEQRGLGDAVYYARSFTADEPFVVLLGDTIIDSVIPVTQQILDLYEQYQCAIVAVEQVPEDKVQQYGIVEGNPLSSNVLEVTDLVEKPERGEVRSNLAIAGRYVLTPEIYRAIELTEPDRNNEIQLTDALRLYLQKGRVIAYIIEGKRYDIGNRFDYLKTSIEFALRRKELADEMRKFLQELVVHWGDAEAEEGGNGI